VGDHALPLLPTDSNTILMHWKGAFKVLAKAGHDDYAFEMYGQKRNI
jgi:hypothetical protein